MLSRIKQFIREVIAESKKVTWPGKKEVIGSTIVVMIAVFLTAIFIGVVDYILSLILSLITVS